MSTAVLKAMTSKYLALPLSEHLFAWQGGEPTLMGLDFFRQATALQKRPGKQVRNVLQTNGTLLDHEWGDFLQRQNFLVGISIDGPPEIHDTYRLTPDGAGSSAQVLRGLHHLQECSVEHNVLTLVSAANVRHPNLVYDYLCGLRLRYHQYIECIETDTTGASCPYALRPGEFGEFLCQIFDRWYPHDCQRVSIRLFDSILSRLVNRVPTVCPMGCDCRHYFVIEHDGKVYPCDFFVNDAECLGTCRPRRSKRCCRIIAITPSGGVNSFRPPPVANAASGRCAWATVPKIVGTALACYVRTGSFFTRIPSAVLSNWPPE